MKLSEIGPSQSFINSEKLSKIQAGFKVEKSISIKPLPVKKLGGKVIFTDGHTRALEAFLSGLTEIEVFWDEDGEDWEAYEICVA